MKKSFCRNMIKLTSIEEKRYWNFPSQFFSGWEESQSVSYVPYVSGKCVAELNLSYFFTEAFDSSLRSWRYCVILTLKSFGGGAEIQSKGVGTRSFSRGFAKSHSTDTAASPPNLTRLVHRTASYAGYSIEDVVLNHFHEIMS